MIYFDNGATTLHKPEKVYQAVVKAMKHMGNSARGAHQGSLDAAREIYLARSVLCELFCADDPKNVVFTKNATEALNIAIYGLLDKGDHVITTAMEHNSLLRPLYHMESRGIELTILPLDEFGNISLKDLESSIRKNTKMIAITHVSNVTGNRNPLEKIGQLCKDSHLLFLVDAAQSGGSLRVDMKKDEIDVLCFTGHKGLLGPQGTGGLCVRTGVEITKCFVGGTGIHSFDKEHPSTLPDRLEAGTLNAHGIAGLKAGVEFVLENFQTIEKKERELLVHFYKEVLKIPRVKVYGDFSSFERGPIVSLNLGDVDSSYLSDELMQSYNIATRPGAHCAPLVHESFHTRQQGMVRFSFSYANTLEEVHLALEALAQIERRGPNGL